MEGKMNFLKSLFFLSFLAAISCDSNVKEYFTKITGGYALPALECKELDGEKVIIRAIKGEILVLNYWSIGCSPCREEIPGFNKLVKKYRANKKIRFIAITVNHPEDLQKYLEKNKFEFEHKIKTEQSYKILGGPIPRTIICAQDGMVIYDQLGGNKDMYKRIDKIIEVLLNGGRLYVPE